MQQTIVVQQPMVGGAFGMGGGGFGMGGGGIFFNPTPTPHPIKSSYIVMQGGTRVTCCSQRPFIGYVTCGGRSICCFIPNDGGCQWTGLLILKFIIFVVFFSLAMVFVSLGKEYDVKTSCLVEYIQAADCASVPCSNNCNEFQIKYVTQVESCPNLYLNDTVCQSSYSEEYYSGEIITCYTNSACSSAILESPSYFYGDFAVFFIISLILLFSIYLTLRVCVFAYYPNSYRTCCCSSGN